MNLGDGGCGSFWDSGKKCVSEGGNLTEKMKLYLAKPDLVYFEQFNEMMKEWCESETQIAPWFLDEPFESMEEFWKTQLLWRATRNQSADTGSKI